MIKHYDGFKVEKKAGYKTLPIGGYVAKILGAETVSYSWGDVLVISFDITEGEYKDYFANKYRSDTRDGKKWKGTFRINIPREDSPYVASEKADFNNMIWAVEASNPGYHFDWDEAKFKNKAVGVIIREKEYYFNGNFGITTECGQFTSVEEIRKGTYPSMPLKKLSKKERERMEAEQGIAKEQSSGLQVLDESDGDLPF